MFIDTQEPLGIPVKFLCLGVDELKSSAVEMTLEIRGHGKHPLVTLRSISHSGKTYVWVDETRPHTLLLPPKAYTLKFKVVRRFRGETKTKTKGEAERSLAELLLLRTHMEGHMLRLELQRDDQITNAYLSVHLSLDIPDFPIPLSLQPHFTNLDVLPLPRLVGHTINCMLSDNIRCHSNPAIHSICTFIAMTLWRFLDAEHRGLVSQLTEEPINDQISAMKLDILTSPPHQNIVYDLAEQMSSLMSLISSYFATDAKADYQPDRWSQVLAECCADITGELLHGMLLLFGFSQYYIGGSYTSIRQIARTQSHVNISLEDCLQVQHWLSMLRARFQCGIPPAVQPPDENVFVSSLLRLVLDEFTGGNEQRYQDVVKTLRGPLLQDVYAKLLSTFESSESDALDRDARRRFLTQLVQHTGNSPDILWLVDIKRLGDSIDGGGSAEIFPGELFVNNGTVRVAMKRIKMFPRTAETKRRIKQMHLEILSCSTLRHPNVIRVFGIHVDANAAASYILTPLIEHGNLRKYVPRVKNGKEAVEAGSALPLVHALISDIAHGLRYLHSESIAHGDLRGVNILVGSKQQAIIADFGMAVYVNAHSSQFSYIRAGNIRWIAPEALSNDGGLIPSARPTPQADIWSFAHVCIELYTDLDPYPDLRSDREISIRINGPAPAPFGGPPCFVIGSLPIAKSPMPQVLWDTLTGCWTPTGQRLTSNEVVGRLRSLAPKARSSN